MTPCLGTATIDTVDNTERLRYAIGMEIPEPWSSAMLKAGLTDPSTGQPSYRALGREAGIHPTTVANLISGRKDPLKARPETIASISEAIQVPEGILWEWFGEFRDVGLGPYRPPEGSEALTQDQRDKVDNLILKMLPGKKRQS